MEISVVICTYNRAGSLRRTLHSLSEMYIRQRFTWELIIVNNNSTDDTDKAVDGFKKESGLNVRYIFEEKPGLSHARNKGIREARGKIIAFTDDDVIVDRYWLSNMVNAFKETRAECVGGKILPFWEKKRPEWLIEELYGYLALLDLGVQRKRLSIPKIWGANFAVKKEIFQKYGYFDIMRGRKPGKLYGFEETEFIRTLIEKGGTVFYCPEVVVHHCISMERTRKAYFRKWRYDEGELTGLQMGHYTERNIMGIPLYALRKAMKGLFQYLWLRVTAPQNAFLKQLTFMYYLGLIAGRIRYRNSC